MIRARGFIARKVGSGATGSDELADGSAQTSAARSGVKQSAHDAVPYARNAPIVVAKEILDTEFAGHGKDAGPIGVDRNASGFGRACPGAAGRLGAGGPADQEFVEIRNQVVRGAVADPAGCFKPLEVIGLKAHTLGGHEFARAACLLAVINETIAVRSDRGRSRRGIRDGVGAR